MEQEAYIDHSSQQMLSLANLNSGYNLSLKETTIIFLQQIMNDETKKRYYFCFKTLFKHKILEESITISDLNKLNLNVRLDCILQIKELSRSSQQTCAAAFISFFKFLIRSTNGSFMAPVPQKNGVFKTFKRIRNKTTFTALTKTEVKIFISAAYQHSKRMGVFVEMALQSTRRLGEILNTKTKDINCEDLCITFKNSKSKEAKESIVSFPRSFFIKLGNIISNKEQVFIFETKTGKKLQKDYVWRQFKSIERKCNFNKKITPHSIRATAITLYRSYGFSLDELIDLTGHSKLEMVNYYDRSDLKQNPSAKVCLI